jgi:hypothetical protein
MSKNVLDIIERFQTHHALQEEREPETSQASGNGAVAPSVPGKNGMPKNNIFETQGVRVSTITVLGNTEWSPPLDGRDRLVVTLGQIGHALPKDSESVFPARWTWVPANSDFKVPNEASQTKDLMIVEFNDANDQESSQNRKETQT